MDDEFALGYRHTCDHVLLGQQVQVGRGVLISLHKYKAPLRPRDHTLGHHQAAAHRPDDFSDCIARQQCLQQLAAQLVEGEAFKDGGDGFSILAGLCVVSGTRLHLPVLANQGQLALLQPGKHLAVAAQVAVQIHAAMPALQQQRIVGAQHAHVWLLERVAQAVGKLGMQLGALRRAGRRGGAHGAAFSHKQSLPTAGCSLAGHRS